MYCSHCGNEVSDKAEICVKCGYIIKKPQQAKTDDESNIGFSILGFIFPLIGFILYLAWRCDYPLRAKSAGKGTLIRVIVEAFLVAIIFFFYLLYFILLIRLVV